MKNQQDLLSTKGTSEVIRRRAIEILSNEITKEQSHWENLQCKNCVEALKSGKVNNIVVKGEIDRFLEILKLQYTNNYNKANELIEAKKAKIGIERYNQLRDQYSNEALTDQVTNRREADKLVITEEELLRKDSPVYTVDPGNGFFGSPFYSPIKFIGSVEIPVMWSNILILWGFVLLSWISLYFNLLRRSIELAISIRERYLKIGK
jgi:hypothetical protein